MSVKLFRIPEFVINSRKFDHLLHGESVQKLDAEMKKYLIGEGHDEIYSVPCSSCQVAIEAITCFLTDEGLDQNKIKIPICTPPVVSTAITNGIVMAGEKPIGPTLEDNVEWLGNKYALVDQPDYLIEDCAHNPEPFNVSWFRERAIMARVYSFYPTKPLGGIEGGYILTNDKILANFCKTFVNNGMSTEVNSWERTINGLGVKGYMTTLQAEAVLARLKDIEKEKKCIDSYHEIYEALGVQFKLKTYHLSIVQLEDSTIRQKLMDHLSRENIASGIHYKRVSDIDGYSESKTVEDTYLTIPCHADLSVNHVIKIAKIIKEYM